MSTSPDAGPIDPSSRSERALPARRHVRVAVVQIDYHPAFKDTLYDPLFQFERATSSLLPDGVQAAPLRIQPKLQELRRRVRAAYTEQLRRRAAAIVATCKGWDVEILVFPEYALPSEVLESLAHEAGDLIVVAGSHYVDRETIRRGVYERLGDQPHTELMEQSVSPILHNGKLLALVPKLHGAKPELGTMKPGTEWEPVPLPERIAGPMGVLICLDFLSRQSEQHIELAARPLKECRFLAAPALSKTRTLDELKSQALKEARRERRPVLFANYAPYGGSTVFVDEGRDTDLRFFPEHAGRLEPGEEGVVIADIDLGFDASGSSTPYVSTLPIIPIAAASLVYRGTEQAYARWIDTLQTRLDSNKDGIDKLDEISALIREEPPPLPTGESARKRRLLRLAQDIQDESSVEKVRRLATELILPEDILPLSVLRAALARGAADEVQRWVNEVEAGDFGPVAVRLRAPWERLRAEMGSWDQKMRLVANDVITDVRGGPTPHDPKMLVRLLEVYEQELDRGFKEENDRASQLFEQGRYQAARDIYRAMQQRAEDMIARGEAADRPRLKQWALKCKLNAVFSSLNLQEPDEARNVLLSINPGDLSIRNRIQLVEALALIGERDRAEAILPAESEVAESDRMKFIEARQTLELLSGRMPDTLVDTSTIHLRAAALLLTKHDLAGVKERAMKAIQRSEGDALTRAIALQMLIEALRGTLYEIPPDVTLIPAGRHREDVLEALDGHFAELHDKVPVPVRENLERSEVLFRALTQDTDWLEQTSVPPDGKQESSDHDTAHKLALRLALAGRVEEALRALPPDNHPWIGRFDRIRLLVSSKRVDRALDEALVLVSDFPERAPIEYVAAELLASAGRVGEALTHAERAFQQLPGKGFRLLLANQRLANGNAEGAWELLKDLEGDERPRVLRERALAAERTGRLDQAQKAWRRYVERRPEDGIARVQFAQLLFRLHRAEDAAEVAWKVFLNQGHQLDMDALHVCGWIQRLDPRLDMDAEQTRRIKQIAARLKERFPTDTKADYLRLELLTLLGEIPEDAVPIDFAKLTEAGYVRKGEGDSAFVEYLSRRQQHLDAVVQLARHGAIPITTTCSLSNTPLALLVTAVLERIRENAGFLCPPVSLIDHLPAFPLESATLLVSDLEILLLEVLELIPALQKALGPEGRLILFQHPSDRIVADAATLRASARFDRHGEIEALLRSVERFRTVDPDLNAPFDDVAAARRAGAAFIDDEEHARVVRISPRAFVRTLQEQRIIDVEQRKRIESRLSPEPEPLPALPEPFPDRIVASWFFLEELFRAKALDAVFDAYPEQLRLGPTVLPHLHQKRDEFADALQAHKLADRVHARLIEGRTNGWIRVQHEPAVTDLPALREPDNTWHQKLILDPIREMLAYPYAILANPTWWWLTTESFGSTTLGAPDLLSRLAWNGQEGYMALVRLLRDATRRAVPLPALIRHLVHEPEDAYNRLRKLAELGFPDALGVEEILRLEAQYKGLDNGEPKRILDHQEWMAREPGHLGGNDARLRLAHTYGAVVFEAFFTADRTPARKKALLDTLLQRQEHIGKKADTNTLDQAFAELAVRTANRVQVAWKQESGKTIPDPESHIATLWRSLSAWAGMDGSRRAAHGRALRDVWRSVARLPGGPPLLTAATLALTLMPSKGIEDWAPLEPEIEAVAVLSALWKENPFTQYDKLWVYCIKSVTDKPELIQNPRVAPFNVHLGDDSNPVLIQVPIEAVFLRLPAAEKPNVAQYLKRAQGRYDGICYKHLTAIEQSPDDAKLLADYAEHTAAALFRLVQDDPPFIRLWGQSRRFGLTAERNRFDELLSILSEPQEPLSADKPFRDMLAARVADESGCWFHRLDKPALFAMASEVPGLLPAGTVLGRLHAGVYEAHVRDALDRLDHSDEHPIARIAGDVIFLRVAAARHPSVKLPEGDVDLRDILPARFERLLERVMAPPSPDTLASNEATLLRICSEVIQRLAAPQVVSIHDGLWLTYRIFQWLSLQLETIAPDARRDGMRRLVAQAPKLGAPLDLLDPAGFGRDLFDHRLATVLHALGAMEALVNVLPVDDSDRPLPAPRTVSSPELEDKLLSLAQRAHIGTSMRSVLDWHAPGNVPDLALSALLRLNGARFADMSAEARTRRFEALPNDPQEIETNDQDAFHFASQLVLAAANAASSLTAGERTLLEAKLRAMADGPTSRLWRWFVFVALFADGMDHLEHEAYRLAIEHLGHASAPLVLGRFLLGLAARDPAGVEPMVDAVLDEAGDPRIDAVALIAGALGRVLVHGKPGAQNVAGNLLLRLAKRPLFRDDPRMTEMIGFFSLRELGA